MMSLSVGAVLIRPASCSQAAFRGFPTMPQTHLPHCLGQMTDQQLSLLDRSLSRLPSRRPPSVVRIPESRTCQWNVYPRRIGSVASKCFTSIVLFVSRFDHVTTHSIR